MTVEELLQSRIKVIESYPNSPYKVGQVIPVESCEFFSSYPHLFKKMEWYEDIAGEDLPLYVKITDTGYCFKVKQWAKRFSNWLAKEYLKDFGISIHRLMPITLEEYKQFKKYKKYVGNI